MRHRSYLICRLRRGDTGHGCRMSVNRTSLVRSRARAEIGDGLLELDIRGGSAARALQDRFGPVSSRSTINRPLNAPGAHKGRSPLDYGLAFLVHGLQRRTAGAGGQSVTALTGHPLLRARDRVLAVVAHRRHE
jgi:hypothetical protein